MRERGAFGKYFQPSVLDLRVAEIFRESETLGPVLERWALLDEMGAANDSAFIAELRAIRKKISESVTETRKEFEAIEGLEGDEHERLGFHG